MTTHEWKTPSVNCALQLHRYWAQKYSLAVGVRELGNGAVVYVEVQEPIIMWEEVCDAFVTGWTARGQQTAGQ